MGKGQSVDALPEHYRNGMPSNVVRRDEWLTAGGAALGHLTKNLIFRVHISGVWVGT